jgi:biotin-dependent carboxylase-like uncharacterized protein
MSGPRTATLTVVEPGPLTTVQDSGRPRLASMGVGRSGACDRPAYRLANRLVGNEPAAAVLEVTFGGLQLRTDTEVLVALTGARCPGVPHNAVFRLRSDQTLRLAAPTGGLRTYVGVRGGLAVREVLGSRSTDLLAGLGPPVLSAGTQLPVGPPTQALPNTDVAPVAVPSADEIAVRVILGPRDDWFTEAGRYTLVHETYVATSESNRIGVRLDGPVLERARAAELPSEGMARGALQVPPSGKPVLFLADHPVTGGYPVVAYVHDVDVDRCGQLAPGQSIRFRPYRPR